MIAPNDLFSKCHKIIRHLDHGEIYQHERNWMSEGSIAIVELIFVLDLLKVPVRRKLEHTIVELNILAGL